MSKLRHRSANTAGTKPELDLMTPTEHKMLLEFMLYNMEFSMRFIDLVRPFFMSVHLSMTISTQWNTFFKFFYNFQSGWGSARTFLCGCKGHR